MSKYIYTVICTFFHTPYVNSSNFISFMRTTVNLRIYIDNKISDQTENLTKKSTQFLTNAWKLVWNNIENIKIMNTSTVLKFNSFS